MNELKSGKLIRLTDGTSAEVLSRIGQGAQGTVYKVRWKGGEYALKWYLRDPSDAFYENLLHNSSLPVPSRAFLWPLAVTERMAGSAGYVMELIPQGYYSLGDILLGRAQFRSFDKILCAGIAICNAFRNLHLEGLSYQDINDGNIVINPETGAVFIVDNDNVSTNNTNFGIRGKSRYMAAEVIEGGMPNIESDLMSLAIILYRLIMIDHPFEGTMTLRIPCMTEAYERRFYGLEAVFCQDPSNDINRPHKDLHLNSIRRWAMCPQVLKDAFYRAFSRKAIQSPAFRIREKEWRDLFVELRALSVVCPKVRRGGRRHDFLVGSLAETGVCPRCGEKIKLLVQLTFPGRSYVLTPGKNLYLNDDLTPVGECCLFQGTSGKEPGLRNLSTVTWALMTHGGRVRDVPPGEEFPLRPGMQICFSAKVTGTVA